VITSPKAPYFAVHWTFDDEVAANFSERWLPSERLPNVGIGNENFLDYKFNNR
jgi:hypothetical protein